MTFFDNIYVVSLRNRVDRREMMAEDMSKFGLQYQLIDAVKDINGALGLLKSMKLVFEDALANNYSNILVLEDDARFVIPPLPFLRVVLPQIPNGYHCFYFGATFLFTPQRISPNVLKITAAYSTHAICYSREAIEIILPLLDIHLIRPYDILLMQSVQSFGKTYCSFPMLATQRSGWSDIEQKEKDWNTLMFSAYNDHTKNLQYMEEQKCYPVHKWGGAMIVVKAEVHEVQYPQLVGAPCDCGKFTWDEELCGCPGDKHWEAKIKEKVQ